jgi:hypothetical protein
VIGFLLGRDLTAGMLSQVFDLGIVFFGSLIGNGFALSKEL